MKTIRYYFIVLVLLSFAFPASAQILFTDTLVTSQGDLVIHVLGHASVFFEFNGKAVYVDPYSKFYDYTKAVKADLILITHADKDHFDTLAIGQIMKENTLIIYTQACAEKFAYADMDTIMGNGDSIYIMDLSVKAVPAYNEIETKHLKGVGNGYVIVFGEKTIYLCGDSDYIPEMDELENIDVAFLPYSEPYNMTTEMMVEAVIKINPSIVVPYHYDDNDITPLLELLWDIPGIEIWTGRPMPSLVKDKHSNEAVIIFPVPVHDMLYCEKLSLNSSLYIFDMKGSLIMSGRIKEDGRWNVHFLDEGPYLLFIITEKNTYSGRFLKW